MREDRPSRVRSPERATTTETQRRSTNDNDYLEEYDRLCKRVKASERDLLDTEHLLREADVRLRIAVFYLHSATGRLTFSEDEAVACEYPFEHFRDATEATMLRDYLELEACNEKLDLAVLQIDHRMHSRKSRDSADSLEKLGKLLQNDLTDPKSVKNLRHEVELSRAIADHAKSDFQLGDQHRENLLAIREGTIKEFFRNEDVTEVILRGLTLEFNERVQYRRTWDNSRRQWDAQLQALHKNHIESYRRLSLRNAEVVNNASGNISREDRVGEKGEMPHPSHEGIGEINNRPQSLNDFPNERANPAGPSSISHHPDWTLPPGLSQAYSSFRQRQSDWTLPPGLSQAYFAFRQRNSPPTTPASSSTPNTPPSASPLQCAPSSTDPSTSTSLAFSHAEFELAIQANVTGNLNIDSAPPHFESPSHLPFEPIPMPWLGPTTEITATTPASFYWSTPQCRTWIYRNLVDVCGFPEYYAHAVVMRWMGGLNTFRHMSLFDWQAVTTSYHAGWYMFKQVRQSI
ncbi:hypothetical protein EAE96_004812 [Botrytis aclada]|nr:hypothetical protein EAE96_004812 [Botrytis aclada]